MQDPYIQCIAKGEGKALVFLNGYRMKYEENGEIWTAHLRQSNWQGAIYQLWWDAGSIYGIKNMSPLGRIPIANEIIHGYPHWQVIIKRAKTTGLKYFQSLIASIPETQISLIGYSLGCRVIHYGMLNYKPESSTKSIQNIYLLAGAIRTIKWDEIANKISGKVYNFYNANDHVLREYFSIKGTYKHKPCGLSPIRSTSHGIQNTNITKVVNTQKHDLIIYLIALEGFNYFQ